MRYLLLCGMVLSLAACGVKPPIEGRANPYPIAQINFASEDLRQKTAIDPVIMARKNGILYVTVPIRSASDYDLHVDYQITFLNAEGEPIYTGPWENGPVLVRNTWQHIQFHSPTGDAADFRMNLRYAE